jgi:hypothetical protein
VVEDEFVEVQAAKPNVATAKNKIDFFITCFFLFLIN